MQKILRRRVIRDLKKNWFRYLALGLLIIFCMYIIIGLMGAADTIIQGVEKYCEEYNLEDGEFRVFVPLTEKEKKELEDLGVELEKQFYLDFKLEDTSTLRVMKNREQINKVKLEEGKYAQTTQEIMLEKRYCEEQDLLVGDKVQIAGMEFEITGIGCAPDYDSPLKEFGDSTIDSKQFGIAFVSEEGYKELRKSKKSIKAQEYVYAYSLKEDTTAKELKDTLNDHKVSSEEIEDEYFQEYWKKQTEEKEDMQEGIQELADGSQELSDALKDMTAFQTGIVEFDDGLSEVVDGAKDLADGVEELQDNTDEFLDENFDTEISNLVQFVEADDNPRIGTSAEDQLVNKYGGIIAGVVLMILFAYVISVFVIYGIEKENSTIGALYALGVKKQELIRHYLCLPVIVTFIAGVIGALWGFSKAGIEWQMQDCYDYYSFPQMEKVFSPYLLVYAIVMPPLIAAVVNWFIIGKKLDKPALQMLRNEQKQSNISQIQLGNMGFISKFRIRQMLREIRTSLTVLIGMFISLLILMLGVDCHVMCSHISQSYKEDTKYEYMYTYKYPDEKVPEGGYEAFSVGMKKERLGYNLDVTVMGITKDNPYFDLETTDNKNEVVISSAMAEKYDLKIGEVVVLKDEEQEQNYAFTVKDITQYSIGFYVFMDIEHMRELFGEEDDYYNVVFSDEELEIDSGKLYSTTTRDDIVAASDVFINMLKSMVIMMVSCSAVIFAVVMYLMMKVMIDRSAFHISMMKVFGYRMREIKKLYLNGNFYIIAVGAAICLPLSKKCMDALYPMMVSNVSCSMNLTFSWELYLGIYLGIIALYFVINSVLVYRLKKVDLADVLKNRE